MLFLLTIFIIAGGVYWLSLIIRRSVVKQIEDKPPTFIPAENYKSLFAADEAEIRKLEAQEIRAADISAQNIARERALSQVSEKRKLWEAMPNARNTVEFLFTVSAAGDANLYEKASNEVTAQWMAGERDLISAEDLSQMIESHFWLLPDAERGKRSGFWLKNLIAEIRRTQ